MKASVQLPLVDPDFRLVERRPQTLHAYARGLLQHLRAIRAGEKAEGYPIATIKSGCGLADRILRGSGRGTRSGGGPPGQ